MAKSQRGGIQSQRCGIQVVCMLLLAQDVRGDEDSAVDMWMIVLPVTGMALVALFAVFCICRYMCHFISFCTKQCESGGKENKPVSITMPSHSNIHLLMRESPNLSSSLKVEKNADWVELKSLVQDSVDVASASQHMPPSHTKDSASILDENGNRYKKSVIEDNDVDSDVHSALDGNNEISEIAVPQITISSS